MQEMKQLCDRAAFKPMSPSKLLDEEQRKTLESSMFTKEKQDKSLKGRGCTDGRKQQEDAKPGKTASPVVSLEAVLLTSVVDRLKMKDAETADIPNALAQTNMDANDVTVVKLWGRLAESLVQTVSEICQKHTVMENGKTIPCAKLLKILCGALKAASWFHKKIVKDLESQGFKINPCDLCAANKMLNGKHVTVLWHVDNMKISHADEVENDKLILLNKLQCVGTTRAQFS